MVQVSGSEKGVNLLTAHGSKGLEFENVFITGMQCYLWEKKEKRSDGYSISGYIVFIVTNPEMLKKNYAACFMWRLPGPKKICKFHSSK